MKSYCENRKKTQLYYLPMIHLLYFSYINNFVFLQNIINVNTAYLSLYHILRMRSYSICQQCLSEYQSLCQFVVHPCFFLMSQKCSCKELDYTKRTGFFGRKYISLFVSSLLLSKCLRVSVFFCFS